VLDSILQNNFILFLKIDGVVEGFASGNIRDNPRKPMIYIDILCSNPIKYQGIGKKLMDFFKYTILLTYLKDLENENVDAPIRYALRLNSVNNSNTMKFYEKNGMKCLEHEIKYKPSKDDILYPYIWKLDFLLDKEDHPAIIERMLEYKINDGIKWTNSNEYSGRQTLVERDELSVPSVMTHSRGGTRKKLPLKNKFKH